MKYLVMYHYVYKLVEIKTGEFYFGSRSTNMHPSIDSYLGSMRTWKPNKSNLVKTIIKLDFIYREDAIQYEAELIKLNIENPLNRNYHIPNKWKIGKTQKYNRWKHREN